MKCINCIQQYSHTLSWDALTKYKCNLCWLTKLSWNTHIPWFCCSECSESNKQCIECWSEYIVNNNFWLLFEYYEEKETIIFSIVIAKSLFYYIILLV